jgi:hypothetical protein
MDAAVRVRRRVSDLPVDARDRHRHGPGSRVEDPLDGRLRLLVDGVDPETAERDTDRGHDGDE